MDHQSQKLNKSRPAAVGFALALARFHCDAKRRHFPRKGFAMKNVARLVSLGFFLFCALFIVAEEPKGKDYHDQDLQGKDFAKASLNGADFSDATLKGV